MPEVSINVLNYNTYEKTRNCIVSCLAQKGIEYTVLLIDNNSTDNSLDRLKEEFGTKIDYLVNDDNYGYAKGNNIGVQYCLEKGIRYSLILNSDITLKGEQLLRGLLEAAKSDKRYAVVAPEIYNVTKTGLVLNQNDSSYLSLLRKFGVIPRNHEINNCLCTISEAQGSALLVDNKEFIKVGGFPEHYFMYGEEGCFAKKILWDERLIVWYKDRDNYALHHHDKSVNVDEWRLFLMGRNRYLEMYENKRKSNFMWPLAFNMFMVQMYIRSFRNQGLRVYIKGINEGKKIKKMKLSDSNIYAKAASLVNNYPEGCYKT